MGKIPARWMVLIPSSSSSVSVATVLLWCFVLCRLVETEDAAAAAANNVEDRARNIEARRSGDVVVVMAEADGRWYSQCNEAMAGNDGGIVDFGGCIAEGSCWRPLKRGRLERNNKTIQYEESS
jgi:hypothetical protein